MFICMGFSHGLPTTRGKCVTDSNLFSETVKSANAKLRRESASEDRVSQITSSMDHGFVLLYARGTEIHCEISHYLSLTCLRIIINVSRMTRCVFPRGCLLRKGLEFQEKRRVNALGNMHPMSLTETKVSLQYIM